MPGATFVKPLYYFTAQSKCYIHLIYHASICEHKNSVTDNPLKLDVIIAIGMVSFVVVFGIVVTIIYRCNSTVAVKVHTAHDHPHSQLDGSDVDPSTAKGKSVTILMGHELYLWEVESYNTDQKSNHDSAGKKAKKKKQKNNKPHKNKNKKKNKDEKFKPLADIVDSKDSETMNTEDIEPSGTESRGPIGSSNNKDRGPDNIIESEVSKIEDKELNNTGEIGLAETGDKVAVDAAEVGLANIADKQPATTMDNEVAKTVSEKINTKIEIKDSKQSKKKQKSKTSEKSPKAEGSQQNKINLPKTQPRKRRSTGK